MLQKIIDVLNNNIEDFYNDGKGVIWAIPKWRIEELAEEILALKYQIARELYNEWWSDPDVPPFNQWLDQQENK